MICVEALNSCFLHQEIDFLRWKMLFEDGLKIFESIDFVCNSLSACAAVISLKSLCLIARRA